MTPEEERDAIMRILSAMAIGIKPVISIEVEPSITITSEMTDTGIERFRFECERRLAELRSIK
ncbi:hypothetical protein GM539_14290 [Streptococcus pneumoniae]|uniref:Uncharacterized protein n=1 Tax=Streptococcus pneumoniae TaxID=1313 RepID=A0A6G2D6M9_STREE|nr:hypothetical protein [Streptococcus pneumoniae]